MTLVEAQEAALMAFLPGREGGGAIADTLFGRSNPSGRLTVSWPKSSDQQPLAYNEPGKPYDPRYPFGHGLSYSRIEVRDLDAPRRVDQRDEVPVSVELRNASPIGSEYVVLAFVERLSGPVTASPRQLVAFEREHLRGFDRDRVHLSFDVEQLAVTQEGDKSVVPGRYRLVVGGRSQKFRVH